MNVDVLSVRVKFTTRYGAVSMWRLRVVVWCAKLMRVPLDFVEDK